MMASTVFQTWPCQTWPCQLPGANVVASPKIPSLPAHWYAATSLKPTALGCREFKCIGDKPPQDHPHIYLNMGDASSPRQFFPDCTIAMRGYDFREGQVFDNIRKFVSFRRTYIYRRCDFKQTYALKRRRV